MVSKPIAPPWTDSSKNLVHDLARHFTRTAAAIMTTRGYHHELLQQHVGPSEIAQPIGSRNANSPVNPDKKQAKAKATNLQSLPIYPDKQGKFAPGIVQNIRPMIALLCGRRGESRGASGELTHFFFAPNKRSSQMIRLALKLRRRRTLHTICSIPKVLDDAQPICDTHSSSTENNKDKDAVKKKVINDILFADHNIALSRHTYRRLLAAGVAKNKLSMIYPGIEIPKLPTEKEIEHIRAAFGFGTHEYIVLFAGDYEFSDAARTVALCAQQMLSDTDPSVALRFVYACRTKTAAAEQQKKEIQDLLLPRHADKVTFLGDLSQYSPSAQRPNDRPQTDRIGILDLLSCVDVNVMPTSRLYAKMDLPLVLIESIARGVPVIVADTGSISEVIADPAAGLRVPEHDAPALAKAIMSTTLERMDHAIQGKGQHMRYATRTRDVALKHFDIRKIAQRYESLYAELNEKSRSAIL